MEDGGALRTDADHGIQQFIQDYPGMSIAPSRSSEVVLKGSFSFCARPRGGGAEIRDSYELRIDVPRAFPEELPNVTETGHKIPRDDTYHVNPDGTLCLGSPLRLKGKIEGRPDLVGFAKHCLVPYLYGASHRLMHGADGFPFGELAHGVEGIINDYAKLFGLQEREQAIRALELLGMKRRMANKESCPCGCGRRLGRCSFNVRLGKFRDWASRTWFRDHAAKLRGEHSRLRRSQHTPASLRQPGGLSRRRGAQEAPL